MKKENRPMRVDYPNGVELKLHNRSVTVLNLDQDDVGLMFKIVTSDTEPRAISESVRGKFVKTQIRLSREAALALQYCLNEHFKIQY
jgi:hypothetical protein